MILCIFHSFGQVSFLSFPFLSLYFHSICLPQNCSHLLFQSQWGKWNFRWSSEMDGRKREGGKNPEGRMAGEEEEDGEEEEGRRMKKDGGRRGQQNPRKGMKLRDEGGEGRKREEPRERDPKGANRAIGEGEGVDAVGTLPPSVSNSLAKSNSPFPRFVCPYHSHISSLFSHLPPPQLLTSHIALAD